MQSRGDKTRVVCSHGRSRGPSCTYTFRIRVANHTPRTYIYACMTVMEGSGKSRMCLQHGGNLKVPYTSRATGVLRPRFPSKPISVMRCVIILNDSSVFESIPSITHVVYSLAEDNIIFFSLFVSLLFLKNFFKTEREKEKKRGKENL